MPTVGKATDLTVEEGVPVYPHPRIVRDADEKVVLNVGMGSATVKLDVQGSRVAGLAEPLAGLVYLMAVGLIMTVVLVGGSALRLSGYFTVCAAVTAGVGAGYLLCHLARHSRAVSLVPVEVHASGPDDDRQLL